MLDAAELHKASQEMVKDADFGSPFYEEALSVLLKALREEARLTNQGQWITASRQLASLKRRRFLSQMLSKHPEIQEQEISRPIFIIGFPRTGTTMLHNLLGTNPQNRAIRLWEMREPFSPEGRDEASIEESKLVTDQVVKATYALSPNLANIHPLKADWPDECSFLFRNSFATYVLAFSYYIPTYARWLQNRDMTEDYAYYRQQLQAILFQRPGAPLVLKDPCHTWHMRTLAKTFPDARFIHLHRPIEQVVGSFCSLVYALHDGSCDIRSKEEIGRYALNMLHLAAEEAVKAREEMPHQVIDIAYRDQIKDPQGTLMSIHQQFDLPFDEKAQELAANWLGASKKHTGRHKYNLSMFGLELEEVQEAMSSYTQKFAAWLPI